MAPPPVGDDHIPPVAGGSDIADEGLDRVFTLPNVISFVRLLCIPVFVYLLFGRDDRFGAALLLAAIGSTDWIDGFIARRWKQVTSLGKLLDPTADRLMLVVGVVSILIDGSVPVVVAVLTIVREALVFAMAIALLSVGAKPIAVTWWGKAGTFGLMFAYPLFLAGASDVSWADTADLLAWICVVPGLVLGYLAAALYVAPAVASFRAARSEHRGGGVGSPA